MCNFDNTEKILVNLKVIGKVLEGSKLHISNSYFEIDNSNTLIQWMTRWFKSDSREKTINLLRQLIRSTANEITRIIIVETCRKDKEKNAELLDTLNKLSVTKDDSIKIDNIKLLKTINDDLSNSISGLENLKKTYFFDINLQSKIELIITSINDQIDQINIFLNK